MTVGSCGSDVVPALLSRCQGSRAATYTPISLEFIQGKTPPGLAVLDEPWPVRAT
jgi:hypothetical protein